MAICGKKKVKSHEAHTIVVKEGSRDIMNEAFRVLRTNLEFMIGKDRSSNVIVITSFNPGSGKSFLTMNIAMSLAIKNKKVLVIDGDLRHASASAYIHSPEVGLSNYLGGQVDELSDIIVTDTGIHVLTNEDDDHGNEQPQSKSHQKNVFLYGGGRYHASTRLGDDAGIIGCKCL